MDKNRAISSAKCPNNTVERTRTIPESAWRYDTFSSHYASFAVFCSYSGTATNACLDSWIICKDNIGLWLDASPECLQWESDFAQRLQQAISDASKLLPMKLVVSAVSWLSRVTFQSQGLRDFCFWSWNHNIWGYLNIGWCSIGRPCGLPPMASLSLNSTWIGECLPLWMPNTASGWQLVLSYQGASAHIMHF